MNKMKNIFAGVVVVLLSLVVAFIVLLFIFRVAGFEDYSRAEQSPRFGVQLHAGFTS